MANEVVKTFGDALSDNLTEVALALPREFNKERFIQNTLSVLNSNPELGKCNKTSLLESVMKASYLGLDFALKECYVIPYGSSAQFQTSYIGAIKFVKKYSIRPIKDIYAKVVRKGDEFQETIVDGHPSINFKPIPFNGAEIVGAFAVCLFEDGGMIYEVMSTKEINDVRNNYSKAARSKAWQNSWDQMAIKTVLRRMTKHIETDFESVEARNAWDEDAGMDFSNSGSSIDHSNIVNAFAKEEQNEDNIIDGECTEIPDVEGFAKP